MRILSSNNHCRQSVAGQGSHQPKRGARNSNDEYVMKKTFISGALALLSWLIPLTSRRNRYQWQSRPENPSNPISKPRKRPTWPRTGPP
jgi:hypothetical protein